MMEIENKKTKNQKGFALLTAIIITGMLLLVSFVVADLSYKELILTSTGQQSQIAFYMADSGAECALYWDLKNGPVSAFDPSNNSGSVTCNNQTVTTGSQTVQTIPTQQSQVGGGGGGGSGVYSYYRPVVINHSQVPSSQSSFPVLVCANGSGSCNTSVPSLMITTSGGHVNNPSGYDIGFYSDNNCTTKLPWEMENYVPGTGETEAWVSVPNVSSSADTTIYMCYGGSMITDQSNKTGVWDSNYKGVWHLSTSNFLTDSTGVNNLTNNSSVQQASMQIDGGATFNGSNYLSNTIATGIPTSGQVTISAWLVPGDFGTFRSAIDFSSTAGTGSVLAVLTESSQLYSYYGSADRLSSMGVSTGSKYYASFVYDISAKTVTFYINGNYDNSYTVGSVSMPSAGIYIGSLNGSGGYWNGSVDEVRISSTARTANWIKTEYNNQSSPATFDPIGSEVSGSFGSGGGPAVPSIFQINFANSCAIVQVTKNADGTTKIDSRGYNTCDTSVARRFERGITITY
jgi:hypothetical protein